MSRYRFSFSGSVLYVKRQEKCWDKESAHLRVQFFRLRFFDIDLYFSIQDTHAFATGLELPARMRYKPKAPRTVLTMRVRPLS